MTIRHTSVVLGGGVVWVFDHSKTGRQRGGVMGVCDGETSWRKFKKKSH